MSRIVVAGIGTPSFVDAVRHFGPGRRSAHLAFALADAGHEVTLLWRHDDAAAGVPSTSTVSTTGGACLRARAVPPRAFAGSRLAEDLRELGPEVLVGATVHAAARLACVVSPSVPLWVDVFGDPMAEAQAKASLDGNDDSLGVYWEALAAVLARGDHFSAVSATQSHALVGQLGLAGRLIGRAAGEELVSVMPCAAEVHPAPARPWLRGSRVPEDAVVAIFSGSFNTWCDVETLVAGVDRAMDLDPSIHFVATGGPVPGHCEWAVRDFETRVERSRHRRRFHRLGWISPDRLAALLLESDVGLNIERTVYERRLGAENRVTEWLAYGVPAVTSAQSDLGRTLVDRGLAFEVRPGDPDDLSRTLVYLARDRARLRAARDACRDYAVRRLGLGETAGPLVDWCARPRCAPRAGVEPRLALVSSPDAVAKLVDQYLSSLGAGELGYRSARWLWRRLARSRSGRGPA